MLNVQRHVQDHFTPFPLINVNATASFIDLAERARNLRPMSPHYASGLAGWRAQMFALVYGPFGKDGAQKRNSPSLSHQVQTRLQIEF